MTTKIFRSADQFHAGLCACTEMCLYQGTWSAENPYELRSQSCESSTVTVAKMEEGSDCDEDL